MNNVIFSLEFKGDLVEVVETLTGAYQVNYYQMGTPVVSLKKYNLEKAMELARAFVDDDGEVNQ